MITLTEILNRFLSESIQNSTDETLKLRSKIVVGITLMYFSSMVSLALLLFSLSYLKIIVLWAPFFSCTFSSTCYLFQIIYFKKTGNLPTAAFITMSILLFFTSMFTYLTGGLHSPIVLFLFVVPMCAFLVTGHKPGIFWSALTIAVYLTFVAMDFANISTPHLIADEYQKLIEFFSWIFSWVMIVGGVMLYSGIVNNLNSSINNEKEKLRHKATFDEESGAYTRKAFSQLIAQKHRTSVTAQKLIILAFMELTFIHETEKKNLPDMLKIFLTEIQKQVGDQAIFSRYGTLSITALISQQDSYDSAQATLESLYQHLQNTMDAYNIRVDLGATIAPDTLSEINTATEDARKALTSAKEQDKKIVIFRRGEKRVNDHDYLSQIVTTPFDQLIKRR